MNTKLFSPANLLIIAVFAIAWQLIFSRVNLWLHKSDSPAPADATM